MRTSDANLAAIRNAEQRRDVLSVILIAVLTMQLGGFGAESRTQQSIVILLAIASWVAVEFYGRNFAEISARWSQFWSTFLASSNARRRLAYAAAMVFPSSYIIITRILAGDNTPDNGDALVAGIWIVGICWLAMECFNVAEYHQSLPVQLGPHIPDEFPDGAIIDTLRAQAGEGASCHKLLDVARQYSSQEEWLSLCRYLIAINMPDSEFAVELAGQPSEYDWAVPAFDIRREKPIPLSMPFDR